MFSIKNSFADCMGCSLLSEPSCILETNCEYLEEVDLVLIAESPDKDEVEKEKPLIGKAGKMFRKYFEKFGLNKTKYLITNVVLCQTLNPDGTTGNPSPDVIERCRENCFKIIENCKPKLIVLLGSSPTSAFGLLPKGVGVTNIRGEKFKWNGYDTFIMLHPSYINRQKTLEPTFESDMKKVSELLGIKNISEVKNNLSGKNEPFYYKIPDKYYTSNYKLIDIQFLTKSSEVLYIFRDKDNKKEYYKTNDEYVCYQMNEESKSRKIVKFEDLNQIKVSYKDKYSLNPKITYEGDLKITTKHSIDYYLTKKQEEPKIPMNAMFLDIETYSKTKVHSNAVDAEDFIAIIRYSYHDIKKSLVLDPKSIGIEDQEIDNSIGDIVICKTESQLISTFINDVRNLDPDFLSGWYSNDFDMKYIFNRAKKINVDATKMSRFGEADYNKYQFYPDIAGCVCLDMLELYKTFTFGGRESYSLDFISLLEIKEGKSEKSGDFSELFRNDINRAIQYNRIDVNLLEGLNKKLNHIFLQDELKRICKNSFKGAKSTLGQLDSLIVSFLKERGYGSKNAEITESDVKFEGAYVQSPIVGVHDYVVDFDFTSLYPSLILTYNIGVNTFVMKLKDHQMGYDLCYCPEKLPEMIDILVDPTFENKPMTVSKEQLFNKVKDNNLTYTVNGCFYKSHNQELSFYSEILEGLLGSRKEYKKKKFEAVNTDDKELEDLYETRQLVYKVLSNALYGILGNKVFRFFNVDCARSITLSGQEAIKNVIKSSEEFINSKIIKKPHKVVNIEKQEMFTDDMKLDLKNVVTSDTDSVFLTYKNLISDRENKEKAKEMIDQLNGEVQNFLNKDIVETMLLKHNVPLEKNRLSLKNEYVIKRGLFVSSKHYANYIISQEGNPLDKIDVKGLDTRRSDYSSVTKQYLMELLELILKSERLRMPAVIEYVKEKTDIFTKIISDRNTIVGRPVSFGKKIQEYKVLPQGVRGMIAWNDLEFKTFDVGSRGYLFKLKGIDLEKAPKEISVNYDKNFLKKGVKLDVLVVPEEVETVPTYYILDGKAMLDFSWKDRCDILLEPLLKAKQQILTF